MAFWRDHGEVSTGATVHPEGLPGILPVQVLVVSRAPRSITVHRDRITLQLPDGTRLHPLDPVDAAGPKPGISAGGAGELCVALPLCAVALAIIVAQALSLAGLPAQKAAYQIRVEQYTAGSFPAAAALDPGQRAEGFVFFRLPEGPRDPVTGAYLSPPAWQK